MGQYKTICKILEPLPLARQWTKSPGIMTRQWTKSPGIMTMQWTKSPGIMTMQKKVVYPASPQQSPWQSGSEV